MIRSAGPWLSWYKNSPYRTAAIDVMAHPHAGALKRQAKYHAVQLKSAPWASTANHCQGNDGG